MARPIATYTFLPWLRQGLANNIATADGDATVTQRASVDAAVTLTAQGLDGTVTSTDVPRPLQLIGPGDVIGIDRRAIVKTEPRDRITNFEPNGLAHIEFYDEDFPWRYTPDADAPLTASACDALVPAGRRVHEGPRDRERPLPYIGCAEAPTPLPRLTSSGPGLRTCEPPYRARRDRW
jgi:hypothetical protein